MEEPIYQIKQWNKVGRTLRRSEIRRFRSRFVSCCKKEPTAITLTNANDNKSNKCLSFLITFKFSLWSCACPRWLIYSITIMLKFIGIFYRWFCAWRQVYIGISWKKVKKVIVHICIAIFNINLVFSAEQIFLLHCSKKKRVGSSFRCFRWQPFPAPEGSPKGLVVASVASFKRLVTKLVRWSIWKLEEDKQASFSEMTYTRKLANSLEILFEHDDVNIYDGELVSEATQRSGILKGKEDGGRKIDIMA